MIVKTSNHKGTTLSDEFYDKLITKSISKELASINPNNEIQSKKFPDIDVICLNNLFWEQNSITRAFGMIAFVWDEISNEEKCTSVSRSDLLRKCGVQYSRMDENLLDVAITEKINSGEFLQYTQNETFFSYHTNIF